MFGHFETAVLVVVVNGLTILETGKFNLGKLYESIGFNKEIISRGRYAELTAAEQRPFRLVSVVLLRRIPLL